MDYITVVNCIKEKTAIKEEQNKRIEEQIDNPSSSDKPKPLITKENEEELQRKFDNLKSVKHSPNVVKGMPDWVKKAKNIE